jgi:hypothetical protein
MYFDEKMPEEHKSYHWLGRSSFGGRPGLFRPVRLANLYEKRDVELVDGGVHDNQEWRITGAGLQCYSGKRASGTCRGAQPSRLETSVLPRSNNILMARVPKWNIGISLRGRKRAFA